MSETEAEQVLDALGVIWVEQTNWFNKDIDYLATIDDYAIDITENGESMYLFSIYRSNDNWPSVQISAEYDSLQKAKSISIKIVRFLQDNL